MGRRLGERQRPARREGKEHETGWDAQVRTTVPAHESIYKTISSTASFPCFFPPPIMSHMMFLLIISASYDYATTNSRRDTSLSLCLSHPSTCAYIRACTSVGSHFFLLAQRKSSLAFFFFLSCDVKPFWSIAHIWSHYLYQKWVVRSW